MLEQKRSKWPNKGWWSGSRGKSTCLAREWPRNTQKMTFNFFIYLGRED
jgi:hypothetical protein